MTTPAFSLHADEVTEIAATLRRRHKALPWTEEAMLPLLASECRPMDTYWAVVGLRDCGTTRCVPALKALATHPKQDIKATAILTIAQVAGASETPYFAERLLDPAYKAKGFALWALGEVGDVRALGAVMDYARRRRKALAEAWIDPREQIEIVAFLFRVVGITTTQALLDGEFAWLRTTLADSMARMNVVGLDHFLARVPGLRFV